MSYSFSFLNFQKLKEYFLKRKTWLAKDLEEVFAFFSEPRNLEEITPPWLQFKVLKTTVCSMAEGALIDYSLKIHGIPLQWQSEITGWDPPHCFVDQQRRGPYRFWVHEHRFVAKDGGTLAEDFVRYGVSGGWLVNKLLVAPDLQRIFNYRENQLVAHFSD